MIFFFLQNKSGMKRIEEDLARARATIRKAIRTRNYTSHDNEESFIPRGCIYRNAYAFHQLSCERLYILHIYLVSFL